MKLFQNSPTLNFAKFLWHNYRSYTLIGLLVLTIGAIVDASSALMIAPIFDLILQEHGQSQNSTKFTEYILSFLDNLSIPQSTTAVLLIFLFIYILRSLLSVLAGWYEAKIRASICKLMTVNLFKSVINANWKFFLNKNQGEFINSITRETQYVGFAYQAFSNCIIAIFQVFTFGLIALFVSWNLTLICISIALVFAIPMMIVANLNYRWGQESVEVASVSNSITQESFSLSKIIQAFGWQQRSLEKIEEQQVRQMNLNIKFYTIAKAMQEFYYPLGLVSVISGFYFAKYFNISFTQLTVVLYCLWKCVPYISSFLRSKGQLGQYLPSFENIVTLDQEAKKNQLPVGGVKYDGFKDKILLKNVSFSYYESEEPVLKNINFSLTKGKMTAIVGQSGSGKSTLADIIMGFHEIKSGEYLVDDKEFSEFDLGSFRKSIGYVPQQSVLFNTSIRENLLWAKEDATEDDLMEACRQANALEFINKMSKKLDTIVGDRGIQLSGGQVQRIALARALLRKPQILVLDEATSSLDSESESLIQDAIIKISKETTMFVIAHRFSTIRTADCIYVLNEGKVLESGSYQDLKRNEETAFSNMLLKQEILNKVN